MRRFFIFLSYLQAFMLGGYFTSWIKFNHSVEFHRWMLTSFFFVMSLIAAETNKKR